MRAFLLFVCDEWAVIRAITVAMLSAAVAWPVCALRDLVRL